MTGFYGYLESVLPIRQILISLAVGMVALFIVLISGLTSDFVRGATVASRTFSAFCFASLLTFIFLMSCEEYAIFKTKRELESFVDDAPLAETDEDFNRAEYLHEEEEPATEPETFHPMDFANLSNQH
ncbi:MAG: hypothetical protein IJT47_02175 [Selenomonadaceae bacterium]|nr:hypothetical protein [Selenomonadaceae bacterium]MBQ7493218.1 hypothetical protein [Selenomonadaceae bacterium]